MHGMQAHTTEGGNLGSALRLQLSSNGAEGAHTIVTICHLLLRKSGGERHSGFAL